MDSEVENFVTRSINSGKDTKTIVSELISDYGFTRNSANSLVKKMRQCLGIHHKNNNNYNEYEDMYEDEKYIGGKVRSTKKKKFRD